MIAPSRIVAGLEVAPIGVGIRREPEPDRARVRRLNARSPPCSTQRTGRAPSATAPGRHTGQAGFLPRLDTAGLGDLAGLVERFGDVVGRIVAGVLMLAGPAREGG